MKVQDVMTSPAHSCTAGTTLVEAAQAMSNYDCGALPVLDSTGRPIGLITDRDICMAIANKNRFPAGISVREVMSDHPLVCTATDEIDTALRTMSARQVRRLPVVNEEGCLVGIVSISDVAAARSGRRGAVGADAVHRMVAETLEKICAPRIENQTGTAS